MNIYFNKSRFNSWSHELPLPENISSRTQPEPRDEAFRPEPTLCSTCQDLRVDWILLRDFRSGRSPPRYGNPIHEDLRSFCLGNIQSTWTSCRCCEVIFNAELHGTRWRTAAEDPYEPLSEADAMETVRSSKVLYRSRSRDDPNKSRILMCEYGNDKLNRKLSALFEIQTRSEIPSPRQGLLSSKPGSMALPERFLSVESAAPRIHTWLDKCQEHELCSNLLTRQTILPDRVLDIGTMVEPKIRLIQTQNDIGTYVALSYCWGSGQTYVLTQNLLRTFSDHVEESDLPQTITEAIRLTRTLQIPYIWIDALCIIQDSKEDWQEQSAKMDQAYSHAHLTICASRASDVINGFMGEQKHTIARWGSWDQGGLKKEDVFLSWMKSSDDMDEVLADEPLSTRGWAVQERLLSSRKVFFTSQQMIWQCPTLRCCGDGAELKPPDLGAELIEQTSQFLSLQNHDLNYSNWERLVFDYTKCKLTKFSDRLLAVSGISRRFGAALDDDYLAGHWRKTLPASLIWQPISEDRDYRPDTLDYAAPSWSWASVDSGVRIEPLSYYEIITTVRSISVDLISPLNPYGQVASGCIELESLVLPVLVERNARRNRYQAFFKDGEDGYQLYCRTMWRKFIWLDRNEDNIDVLAIFTSKGNGLEMYDGIFVTESKSHAGMFERRGAFCSCSLFLLGSTPADDFASDSFRNHDQSNDDFHSRCRSLSDIGQARSQVLKII